MKKILKSKMFCFVLGAILFGSIGVYATAKYVSKDISYTKKDGTVTDVENALNDLYVLESQKGNATYAGIVKGGLNYTGSTQSITLNKTLPKGKYVMAITVSATDKNGAPDTTDVNTPYGTVTGCDKETNLIFSSYGTYYNTTTQHANQWINYRFCEITKDSATISYSETINNDQNIVIIFLKVN